MRTHKEISLFCIDCGKHYTNLVMRCTCGGMIDTEYEVRTTPYPSQNFVEGATFFERFWPVLPIGDPANVQVDMRLKTRTIHATRLQQFSGGPQIWLQDETLLPTGTTKDRAAAVVFPFFRQFGVREFVLSSTGNTSSSFAYLAGYYPDMRIHIFVGKDFAYRLRHIASPDVIKQPNVVTHLINGNFVQAGSEAKKFAAEHNLVWEGGFFNPGRRDGLKTAFIEAVLRIKETPAYYIQAVSSAMGVIGAAKAAQELDIFGLEPKMPKLICVQQASCAPMVHAWNEDEPRILDHHKIAHPIGIAKAILRGDPSATYPITYALVKKSGGQFLATSVEEIKHAQKLLYALEGIWVCEAAACAVAGYLKLMGAGMIENGQGPVVINLTGGDKSGLSA